jgi:single-stranded DNA-binding protein
MINIPRINNISFVGSLTGRAKYKYNKNKTLSCSFSVSIRNTKFDAESKKFDLFDTIFIPVIFNGNNSRKYGKYLNKDCIVYVEGKLVLFSEKINEDRYMARIGCQVKNLQIIKKGEYVKYLQIEHEDAEEEEKEESEAEADELENIIEYEEEEIERPLF